MENHLIQDLNRINNLMGVKPKIVNESTNNVKKLLNEGGRDDIFTKFINVFFGDAGAKLLKNADEGFALLKKQSDELVTAGKITRTEADEAMVLIKKHIDELKNADSLKVVDNLPSETARNRYLVKNFLEKIDPTMISNMRKEIIESLRNSEDYLEWAYYFEDNIFRSAIAKYEKELKAGTTWQITKEDFKKGLPDKFKKLDVNGSFKDVPEMYNDMAEYLDKRVDDFFEGKIPEYDSKFLLKKTPQQIFVDLTSDITKLEGLSDEQIDYLNKVYETKNGTLGTFKLWFDELRKKLKGNQQTYSEKFQTLLQSVETLRDPNIDLLTKRRLANEMSEIFNGLEKLDLDLKFAVEDFINLRLNADELKTFKDLLLGLDLETKASKLVEKSFWPEWTIWVRDAFKERMSSTPDLIKGSLNLTNIVPSFLKRWKATSRMAGNIERVGGEKSVEKQVKEFFWRGTVLNRGDYKSWASYLPMGLEFAGELTNLMFRRNKKQVIKRLTQLGTQYAYSYIYYSLLYAITNTLVELFSSYLITWGLVDKNKENPLFIQSLIITQAQQYNDKLSKIIGNQTMTSEDQPKTNVDQAFEGVWRAFNYTMDSLGSSFSQNMSLLSGFPGGVDNLIGLFRYLFPSESESELRIKQKNIEKKQEEKFIQLENGTLVTPKEVKKEDSYENLQVVISSYGYDVTKYSNKLFQVGQEHINKIGFPIYWMEGIKGKQYFGQDAYEDGKVVLRFTPNSNYEKIQVMIVNRSVWDSPNIYPTLKKDSDWKDVSIITSSEEFVRDNTQKVKVSTQIPENNIKKLIKKIIMESNKDKKFGEENFEHWKKTFRFHTQDAETKEFKEVSKETIEAKQVEIEKMLDHYRKKYDEDDSFVRSVVDVFSKDKNVKNHIKKIGFNKGLAHISETVQVGGLLKVLSVIRESKELEIWSVKYYNDGNWELVKGSFNDEELKNVGKTVTDRNKKDEERRNPVEGLKKKELTAIEILKQDEKKGLSELPSQVKRKTFEKLRNGWVTEKPYDFFDEFYTVSDINTVFNDKIKIYKLNPTKEFFESLLKNSSKIFIRKGFCKSLNIIKNTKISDEKGKKIFDHILNKCQTKFKGEYGITQINKYL